MQMMHPQYGHNIPIPLKGGDIMIPDRLVDSSKTKTFRQFA